MDEKPSILVVDDKLGIDTYFKEFAADQGFNVRIANSTEEAMKEIATDPPELVVADVNKLHDSKRLIDLVEKFDTPLIWASKFKDINFEDLPRIARILNKPFRTIDLKYAIRSEFSKYNKSIPL